MNQRIAVDIFVIGVNRSTAKKEKKTETTRRSSLYPRGCLIGIGRPPLLFSSRLFVVVFPSSFSSSLIISSRCSKLYSVEKKLTLSTHTESSSPMSASMDPPEHDPVANLHMQPVKGILKTTRSIDDTSHDPHQDSTPSVNHSSTSGMTRSESKR